MSRSHAWAGESLDNGIGQHRFYCETFKIWFDSMLSYVVAKWAATASLHPPRDGQHDVVTVLFLGKVEKACRLVTVVSSNDISSDRPPRTAKPHQENEPGSEPQTSIILTIPIFT